MSHQPRLKDLGRWFSGGTPPRDDESAWAGDIPWLSAKDIDRDVLRPPTAFITEAAAVRSSRIVPAGTILMIVRGMALAHGLPVVLTGQRAAFNQDLRALVPDPSHDPRFIQFALRGNRLRLGAHIDKAAHGTARVVDSIYRERVWAPDRTVQRAIADFLDRECERIGQLQKSLRVLANSARANVWASIDDLARVRPTIRLKFLLRAIVDTEHATCPTYEQGLYPVVRTSNVRNGVLDLGEVSRTDETGWRHWTRRRVPQAGDVVFTREAPVGEAAVVPADPALCIGQRSVLLILEPHRVVPEYLVAGLYSHPARTEIELRGRSTTTPHLNVGEIGELPIPSVDLETQAKLVDDLAISRRASDALDERLATCAALLNDYRDSLVAEAVTGVLDVCSVSAAQMDERAHTAAEAAFAATAPVA